MKRTGMAAVFGTVLAMLALNAPAGADWDPGDPDKMHHPQLPDLQAGLNVLDGPYVPAAGAAPYQKFLADDWTCTQSGPVTDIHIWGSWLADENPFIPKRFILGIWSNVSETESATGYSMPGQLLWSARWTPTERRYTEADEGFFDPNQNEIIGTDTLIFQYNFFIPDDGVSTFEQKAGETYWLGATLLQDMDGDDVFTEDDLQEIAERELTYGWKTSADHYMDDAVWIDVDPFGPYITDEMVNGTDAWHELIDPRSGESLDLAFVITPEPATLALVGLGAGGLVAARRRRRK
ncbi:MAG: PEP-CTERM sorting domain-containing protein [Phycisphaerae bacterium]